ncbi:phenylacetate--CoA ligase family protein [candidate division KSB1 bacterium]|nr:phenylacetate--CoA ligase family protein [candidate division KSB1 bacterium]
MNLIKNAARRFYYKLPTRYRMGREYRALRKFLQEAQWWSTDRVAEWQLQRLQAIVRYACDNVPGYHALYKDAGIAPSDIRSLADFKRVPRVDKKLLRDNLADFTSRAIPQSQRIYVTTGGSTGEPLGFYHTRSNHVREAAFLHMSFERSGWRPDESLAILRGAFIGSEQQFWEFDRDKNQLLLSSYFLTERSYEQYIEKILAHKPRHLSAYPSSATMLAAMILSRGEAGRINFQTILLESENIYDWQREKLRAAFPNAKIFGAYGHTEQAVLATMCERSEAYHVWPFYGHAEILNATGNEAQEGESGEAIATSFWNEATPFIRYRTTDFVRKGASHCAQCGRRFQLLDAIEGRLQEFIVTKTGRYISMTALNMHSAVFDRVRQFQFYQDTAGKVVFKVMRKEGYSESDSHMIQRELCKKLGDDMELSLAFVEDIPKTSRGKHRFLEQRLELAYGD